MRLTARVSVLASATLVIILGCLLSLVARDLQEHPASGTHHHPQAAANKNPVPADAKSVAAGQKLFEKYCTNCHGDKGKGDGMEGEELNPRPADLTDAEWKHGDTDGEIYTVIRDGVKGTGMKAFGSKMTSHELWDVVNYVRSLGPK